MSRLAYYRLCLAAPVLIPLAALPFAGLGIKPAVVVLVFAGFGFVFIAVPYTLVAATILMWSRGRTADDLRRVARWLPAFFAPVAGIAVARFYYSPERTLADMTTDFIVGAASCLVIGYLYYVAMIVCDSALYRTNGAQVPDVT